MASGSVSQVWRKRPLDPRGGRRRRRDPGRDGPVVAALDLLDRLHRRAVEEHAAIDVLAIGCQRQQFGFGEQPFTRAVPVSDDHLAPGVRDLAAALQNAAHLDRNDQRFAPPLPLAHPDRDG